MHADPTALAPERLLVFEVRGSISAFASAVESVTGLEFIDEEELAGDEDDKDPVAYLMVPDATALKKIESLWRRWQSDDLIWGETAWRDVFAILRDLRPWGPDDRVQSDDINFLAEEIFGRADDELVKLEVEMVFLANDQIAGERETKIRSEVNERGGRTVSRSRIPEIAYHALLVELPVRVVREIIDRSQDGIAGLVPVRNIRAQSVATTIELADESASVPSVEVGQLAEPILSLFDGVPIAAHVLLNRHVIVDDQFELVANTPVLDRAHGTAMASLIVHGDRNLADSPLPRQIHVVPILGARDKFPENRLIVDMIYTAVSAMRDGEEPTAPSVLIVSLSLGNRRRLFHGQLSPWAKLLDRLAYRFGILFLVSAGNILDRFGVPDFATRTDIEDAQAEQRSTGIVNALGNIVADRRLLAPAETVNGITVGACNDDAVSTAERASARVNIDPYPNLSMSNPSSALGPGFALSVKPDILMPGAREHILVVSNNPHVRIKPASASRQAGIKVAAPPRSGIENCDGFTSGTSAAAALASRTSHRIHDALEANYGNDFLNLSHLQRAVLLKALLVHPAKWPDKTANLIRTTIGPLGVRFHVRQKDNIRRFLGYGFVDGDEAVACAADRATFWATGMLEPNKTTTLSVPVPLAMSGKARVHSLTATLAWFTPISPGRKSYRSVRLKLMEPKQLDKLGVKASSNQPDTNQTRRGTLFTRCWSGDKAPVVGADMSIQLTVQRDPDQGVVIDEPIPFGLAVTLTMPGVVEIYEQVRQRLAIAQRAPA